MTDIAHAGAGSQSARTQSQASPSRLAGAIGRAPTSTVLLALIGTLCVFGTVMVGSASEVISIDTYGSPWSILERQCMWLGLGIVVLAIACRVPYQKWRRASSLLLLAAFAGLLIVLAPGLGVHATGSSRWIGFGAFDVQPSEIMKLALALWGADLVVRRENAGRPDRTIVGPLVLVASAAAILILAQPDMGTAVVLGCITVALLFASGVSLGPLVKLAGLVGAVGVLLAVVEPYRRARLLSFLSPSQHAAGSGYQVMQSLIGLGSGHVLGVGLGNGREKWGYLPNAHTDFIFSVVGEELGIVGAVCVLLLLGALCWWGLRASLRCPDRFGSLLGVAIVAWIAAETVINVGAVIGLLPVTGIPLPFISYGGSSLVLTMAAGGILVSIARQERPRRARSVGRHAYQRHTRTS